MVKTRNEISVFISSPSDVEEERQAVIHAIHEVNKLKAGSLGYQLASITWENDIVPIIGTEPQSAIDNQVGDSYDIFIGIMSTKFGTPTRKAQSGTQHEFEAAYARKKNHPDEVQIMFFFQDVGFSGRPVDATELLKIEQFKSSLSDKGLYAKYETVSEFKEKVKVSLARLLDLIVEQQRNTPSVDTPVECPIMVSSEIQSNEDENILSDPLAILRELELEDEESGLMELTDQVEESFVLATDVLETLGTAIEKLGEDVTSQAARFTLGGAPISRSEAKKIFADTSRSLDLFVETSSAVLPILQKHLGNGIQLTREAMKLASENDRDSDEERDEVVASFLQMNSSMKGSLESIEGFSESIGSLPKFTKEFRISTKRAKAIADGIAGLMRSAIAEIDEVVLLIES